MLSPPELSTLFAEAYLEGQVGQLALGLHLHVAVTLELIELMVTEVYFVAFDEVLQVGAPVAFGAGTGLFDEDSEPGFEDPYPDSVLDGPRRGHLASGCGLDWRPARDPYRD